MNILEQIADSRVWKMLYNADCLSVMKDMPASSIDMAYLDPPFFTQKQQTLTDPDGNKHTFSDKWSSLDNYLEFMRLRLSEVKRLLKPTGSIFLHCDTSASHYLRILLDDIFGSKKRMGENKTCAG